MSKYYRKPTEDEKREARLNAGGWIFDNIPPQKKACKVCKSGKQHPADTTLVVMRKGKARCWECGRQIRAAK